MARCWIFGLFAVAAACTDDRPPAAPVDPYVAELRRRCAAIQPLVEREVGRKLGAVEIVVVSRDGLAALTLPRIRASLARVENGPRGDELDKEANATADSFARSIDVYVDDRGRIVFPDPHEEVNENVTRLEAFFETFKADADPRRLDVILLRELVRVHQHRYLLTPAFHESVRSRADILARRAVLDGHAEYLTSRIATKAGLADVHAAERSGTLGLMKGELIRLKHDGPAPDLVFPARQGRAFVAAWVERLGYDASVARLFHRPPSLAEVSLPDTYAGRGGEPSVWAPVLEDLRRWLTRERGAASIEVIAPWSVLALEGAAAFTEGALLRADDVFIRVLVARDDRGARMLNRAWVDMVEVVDSRLKPETIRRSRAPDRWFAHRRLQFTLNTRRLVLRLGSLVIDVECTHDSELERTVERLAGRARTFLSDPAWRKTWLDGGAAALASKDAGLRLGAVSKQRRFRADPDWEVRWLGRWVEANRETITAKERSAVLAAALADRHPAVAVRALRTAGRLSWDLPEAPLTKALTHPASPVRRAAWAAVKPWNREQVAMLAHIGHALDDVDPIVRERAVGCLTHLADGEGATAVFRKALTAKDPNIRVSALSSLIVYGPNLTDLAPEVAALLEEHPENAAAALGEFGAVAKAALPLLRKTLARPEAREEAAVAIWKIGGDPQPLLALVRDSVAAGEPLGLEPLADVGAAAAPVVPNVVKALAHRSRWIRRQAAAALGAIGGDEARKGLAARLAIETDPATRAAIEGALNKIG